ncbi:hypothetical protein SteCoe_12641 [Stentor coeruleus]|uniref:Uncharacterized protein n=1 Tax=Stentor coeruleus TaxID=5963 RepID=A0A1R2CAA4_9CILI|nr:hypothetical protein SteCoe_12641 [Stentor coeruleus]
MNIEGISRVPQMPKMKQFLKLDLLFSCIYLGVLLGILSALLLIPSSPSTSTTYSKIYFTSNFEPCKLFYYFVLLLSGRVFVAAITLKNYLKAYGLRNKGSFDSIFLLTSGFFLYLFGANSTLVAPSKNYGYVYSLVYSFACYTIPYVLFLHISYLISGVVIKINFSGSDFYRWGYKSWVFLVIILGIAIGLMGYQMYLLYCYERLWIYLGVYLFVALLFVLAYRVIRRVYVITDVFWLAGMCLPLTATPGYVSAVLQSMLLGIYVEGAIRVGFANVFVKRI